MEKYLVVMSVDAMVFEDLEYVLTLPNFKTLFEHGSRVNKMQSIYPTLTHPIHATLITGCYPQRTGIPNNERPITEGQNPGWYNNLDEIKCDTLPHAVKRMGGLTAASRWPLTSRGNEIIDYIIGEVINLNPSDSIEDILHSQGSGAIMETIVRPNIHLLDGQKRPNYDAFGNQCAADIIRQYKPNLMLTHPGQIDSIRHEYGLFNDKIPQAYLLIDAWLGDLIQAAKDAGIYEKTNFVVLSDHGHLNVERIIFPNVRFMEEGLIRVGDDGTVEWDAFIQSAGLSAQVYIKNPSVYSMVEALLDEMKKSGQYGISQVFTKEQVEEWYHLSGGFDFVLEGDGKTSLGSGFTPPLVRDYDVTDYRYGHSSHGHLPDCGSQPPFLCSGPDFAENIVLDRGRIIDVAPTLAQILRVDLRETQGKVMLPLLRR